MKPLPSLPSSALLRTESTRGGVSHLSALCSRPLAVALAAVAIALAFLLSLGAVQPAYADGKTNGTWGTSKWAIVGDTLTVERDGGGHRAGSVASAPWNQGNPEHADMTGVTTIVIGTEQVPVTFEYGSAENLFANLSGIETIDLTHFDTSVNVYDGAVLEGATNMAGMFSNCVDLATLKLGKDFDTSRVTDMSNMFSGCSKLAALDVSKFDTSRCTNMSSLFSGCSSLGTLDVTGFDTSRVANMSGMFSGCEALNTLNVSSFDTSLVESMGEMFSGCKALTFLDVTGFDTSRCTDMTYLFAECSRLGALDVTGFNTSCVNNMSGMFYACGALSTLDVSSFDTSKVTSMSNMFYGCSSLAFLDLSNFAPSKLSDMESMFKGCTGLVSLNLSGFATSKQTNMGDLFSDCTSLSAVRLGKEFGFNDSSSCLPVNVTNAAGMGYYPSMQWIDPKGTQREPVNLNPSEQGAGWYLIQLLAPDAYVFFDWGVRGTPPTFVIATDAPASDPGQLGGRTPKGWVDAVGNSVTFPVSVALGSAVALSATWDKQPFSISDYTWSCPSDITYDGKTHQATVKPNNAFVGAVTNLRYIKSDGSMPASASSPKDAGTYEVLFDVVGNASYVGANDVSLGSFTISKINLEESRGTLRVPLAPIYDGTMKTKNMSITITGGDIVPTEDPLTATATVTYPSGDQPGGSGYNNATVTDIQLENPNYKPPTIIDRQSYTVEYKHDTRIEDFSVVLPGATTGNKAEYNGQPQPAIIKPNDPSIGLGTVTVKYTDEKGTLLSGVPKDVGTYNVSFDVAESATCYDASFDDVGTFTIEPCELNSEVEAKLPSVVVGIPAGPYSNVNITLEGGNIFPSDGPLAATATVKYNKTDIVAPIVEQATVTDVVLSLVKTNMHKNYKVSENYKLEYQAYEVTAKFVPKLADFDVAKVEAEYDGQAHEASVTRKTEGVGEVENVRYFKGGAGSAVDPVDAGTYTLKFDVKETATHAAATDLVVADAVKITPRVLDVGMAAKLGPIDQDTFEETQVNVKLTGGRIVGGAELSAIASKVSYSTAGMAGTRTDAAVVLASLENAPNYTLPEGGLTLINQSYTVIARPPTYEITEGENGTWQQGSAEGLRFVADVELSKLKNISLNGALVDSKNYTAESGSTIVTLKPAYLTTLAPGTHTLRVAFVDGAAETTFTVAAAPKPEGDTSGSRGSTLAPTGDGATPLALVVSALAALAAAGLLAARRARR